MQEDVVSLLEGFVTNFVESVPRLVLAASLFIVGFIIARLAAFLVRKLILYLHRTINESLRKRLLNVDLKSSSVFVSKTMFWILLVATLLMCIQVLQLEFMNSLVNNIIVYLPRVFASVVIVFVGIVSSRLLGDLVTSAASRTGMLKGDYLGRLVRYLILFITIVIAIGQLGIDVGFLTNVVLIVLSGLFFGASLAFGLGAKPTISNILGSYYVRKTFKVGTFVEIHDTKGIISKITDHSVTIETESGLVVIPSKDFSDSKVVINKTQNEH